MSKVVSLREKMDEIKARREQLKKINANQDPTKVTVIKDHGIVPQDVWLNVYITPDNGNAGMAEMFARMRCWKANSADRADVVVFTGGPDVDPSLYNRPAHVLSRFSVQRDSDDLETYSWCLDRGVPMIGICRGAQFLHVMNGGTLYQHVDGHIGDHDILDARNGAVIDKISSTHHQMCVPNREMTILATANQATSKWLDPRREIKGKAGYSDIEAYFYRDTCCLGFQGHPEFRGYGEYTAWVAAIIDDFINQNPDLHYPKKDGHPTQLRMKEELLKQRQQLILLPGVDRE